MADTLRLSEAARLLSIGDTTLKRWTEEGRLQCIRTAGGHRRFRRDDVVKFRSSLLGERQEAPVAPRDGDPRRWLDVQGDPAEPTALLGRMLLLRADARDWAEAGDLLSAGLLQEIANRSQTGKITQAQEHEMARSLEMALARTSHQFPTFPGAPVAVLACPTPERHTLGLTLLEMVLRERGFSVRFLGADVPSHEIIDAVRTTRPALVGLAASSSGRLPSDFSGPALAAATVCRETNARLVLGGNAPWPPVRGAMRMLTLQDLAAFVDAEILRTTPPGTGMYAAHNGLSSIRTAVSANGVSAHAS